MKMMFGICGAVSVGISLLAASSALADGGYGGGHGGGGYGGYHGGGYHGGGYRGGWGGPVVSIGFGGPYYYSDYPATYYNEPAPVVYSAVPTVVYVQPQAVSQPAPSSIQVNAPAPIVQNQLTQPATQKPSMTVADIKALAKGGLSDMVILSQIRSSHAVFDLTTEEIIDLNASKVSQKVIDVMINTGRP